MSAVVLDASAAIAWALAESDPFVARVAAALDAADRSPVHAPALLRLEMANAMRTAVQRGRLQPAQAQQVASTVDELPILFDVADRSAADLLAFALAHELTAYDAAYLELAMRLGGSLLSNDEALNRAARRAGVPT